MSTLIKTERGPDGSDPARATGIDQGLSIYLDIVRLAAALGVLLYHAHHILALALPWRLGDQGNESVAAFFVISGFVMQFTALNKEKDWRTYSAARTARMASVVPLALLVTTLADAAGQSMNLGSYLRGTNHNASALDYLRVLSFSNELWLSHVFVGTNEPVWSLGFEVPYYLFFGLILFVPRRFVLFAILAWLLVCGPKIDLFLPIWLLGVGTYYISRVVSARNPGLDIGIGLLAWSVVIYWLMQYHFHPHGDIAMFRLESLSGAVRRFSYYTLIGLAVCINIISGAILFRRFVVPQIVIAVIRWISGGSFTIYIMHEPLMMLSRALLPNMSLVPWLGFGVVMVILGITLCLAEFGERRKRLFKRLAAKVFRLDPRPLRNTLD